MLARQVSSASYDAASMRKLRRSLSQCTGNGRFRHFTAAEQVFLTVETLSIALAETDQLETLLDAWFKSVEDENTFVPQWFAVRAKQVMGGL